MKLSEKSRRASYRSYTADIEEVKRQFWPLRASNLERRDASLRSFQTVS
jgi:hypothetical protein